MRLARAPLQRSGGQPAPVGSYLYKENVIRHVTLIAKTRYKETYYFAVRITYVGMTDYSEELPDRDKVSYVWVC